MELKIKLHKKLHKKNFDSKHILIAVLKIIAVRLFLAPLSYNKIIIFDYGFFIKVEENV